jgi:hypothetical protein
VSLLTNSPTITADAVTAGTTISHSASPFAIPTANDPTSFPTMGPSRSQALMIPSYFPTFSPSPCPPPTVFPTAVSLTAPSASPSLAATAIAPVVSTSSPSAATIEVPSIAPSIAPIDYSTSADRRNFRSSSAEVFSHLAHPTPHVLGGVIAAGLALLCLPPCGIRYLYVRGAFSSDKKEVKTFSLGGLEFVIDDSLELGSGRGIRNSK